MYVLIGYPGDRCCELAGRALRQRGYEVHFAVDPFADPLVFRWILETTRSESALSLPGGAELKASALRGVLVRGPGGPASADGWTTKDLAYVQAEAHAALIAWLWSLDCPVVNRPTADLWFRPQRPYPEWRQLFEECELPALSVQITNDLNTARRFAEPWGGTAVYAPLTSTSRYPITTPGQWSELARVLDHVPVCLLEPWEEPSTRVTAVGGRTVWNQRSAISPADRAALGPALTRLATRLGLDAVQVEVAPGPRGPRCLAAEICPILELHDDQAQMAIVETLVELLT
jgi:hypothetical protein